MYQITSLYRGKIADRKTVGRDAMLNMVKVIFKQRSEGNETWMYGVGGDIPDKLRRKRKALRGECAWHV